MYTPSFFVFVALPVVFAQYGGGSGSDDSSTKTTVSAAASKSAVDGVHIVKVGAGGLTFEPASVNATVGDVVEFHFYKGTHSVAQSNFADPCQPLNSTGFFSGEQNVSDKVSDTVFSVTVESDDPMWFYCATGQHCQNGMVGVINAPTSGRNILSAYINAAADADSNVEPGSTGGGSLGSAATASPPGTEPASSTETSEPNAGLEARGEIRWGLMSLGVAMTGFFGGMMV